MKSMVIADRSLLGDLARSARTALPEVVLRWVRGPVERVVLANAPTRRKAGSLQRVDVVVGADLVLQRRVVVPPDARKDVTHAIELFIQTETPFSPQDVLVHALEDANRPSDHQISYTLRLLPRAPLGQALVRHKLGNRHIHRILVDGAAADGVDFAPALFPARRYSRWLPALPVALTLISLTVLGAGELSQRSSLVAELEAEVGDVARRVKLVAADVDTRRQQQSGTAAALALLRNSLRVRHAGTGSSTAAAVDRTFAHRHTWGRNAPSRPIGQRTRRRAAPRCRTGHMVQLD